MLLALAEELRPKTLEELVGQEHLTGKGAVIENFYQQGKFPSMILWGPPGCGKTTLARLLITRGDFRSQEFSATVTQASEIKEYLQEALQIARFSRQPPVVLVDEIHYFNRHLQDIFLSYIENNQIILIGATTENPAFRINRALLSRLKIFEFYNLNRQALEKILQRALIHLQNKHQIRLKLNLEADECLFTYAANDARKMLNALDLIAAHCPQEKELDVTDLAMVLQQKSFSYDRRGDDRYQLISAFHKSVRNSDNDSALIWLAYMLERGEDPLYIFRRILRITTEDIGMADPQALAYCLNLYQAFERVGLPEGEIFLIAATVYLCTAPKSNSLYLTEKKLKEILSKVDHLTVPLELINPDNFLAANKGAGRDYQYAHDFEAKTTTLNTMPPEIKAKNFFQAQQIGQEKIIKSRMEYWQKLKAMLSKGSKDEKEHPAR